jgi:hypothetical protein
MSGDSLVFIVIAIIAIFIGIDYLRLQRETDKPKPRVTFSERAQQNPKAFEYILSILSQLEMADAEVLKRYVDVNDQPPKTDIELLDLIDQHSSWQRIADGRAGTVGNHHADEVIYLETLYAAVQKITGPVPSAKREQLHAAVA